MYNEDTNEYILCAATHYNDGVVYKEQPKNIESGIVVCGRRHSNSIMTLIQLKCDGVNDKLMIQGFITSKNRFLNREDAYIIAMKENQIWHNPHDNDSHILVSEDLYFGDD